MDNENNKKNRKKKGDVQAKEHQKNWREVYATVEDIEGFLGGRIMLRRNALTGLVESRWPAEFPGEFMPVSRALQIIGGVVTTKLSDRRLGRAFQDLGFEFRRTSTSRGYVVVQRTAMEIKEKMQRDASDVSDVVTT